MLPYTPEVLYAFLEGYNAALWPAQILAYALALAILWFAWRPRSWSGRATSILLAAAWGASGYVFHLQHFQNLNIFSQYFGPVFLLQALLLFWTGGLRGRLNFAPAGSGDLGRAAALILVALIAVPFLGALDGFGWRPGASVGLAPAPTLLFTLGLLLLQRGRVPLHLLPLPLIAAGIGATEAWLLRLPWEGLPPLLTLLGLLAILVRNSRAEKTSSP